MPVKIERDAKIGDNNAIGDNASVNRSKNESESWFGRHPWLSAIICSLIASIIMLLI